MKPRRRSWVDRSRARYGWLIARALEGAPRPLPMHRRAALWVACRMIEVDLALWRFSHGGRAG